MGAKRSVALSLIACYKRSIACATRSLVQQVQQHSVFVHNVLVTKASLERVLATRRLRGDILPRAC